MGNPFEQAEHDQHPDRKKLLGKLADLLERNEVDVDQAARLKGFNVWQQMYAEVVDCEVCHGTGGTVDAPCPECNGRKTKRVPRLVDMASVQFSSAELLDPEWPVVQQAKPCVVRHRTQAVQSRNSCVTVLLPDPQIGYRRLDDGTMVPMHDERAMATALELLSVIKPDVVVHLGDFMDFAEFSSKFLVLPEFVFTTQQSLDRGHRFLAECRAAAGPRNERTLLLEGNHDNRLPVSIATNAKSAMRLRQANTPESWPVMSVPHLLRLEELGIEYIDGYPAGRVKLAERHDEQAALYALHGERLSMEKQAKAERVSTVQGHAHHFGHWSETGDEGDGVASDVEAWSLGCLCRRDGAVPSTKGGTSTRGRHIERIESWQHGIGVLIEDEDGWDLQPIRIRNGRARWRDKVVTA